MATKQAHFQAAEKALNGLNLKEMTVKEELLAVETLSGKKEEIIRDVITRYKSLYPVTGTKLNNKGETVDVREVDWQNFLLSEVADEFPKDKDGKMEPWSALVKRQEQFRLFGHGVKDGGFTPEQSKWYKRINSAKAWGAMIKGMDNGTAKTTTKVAAEVKAATEAMEQAVKEGKTPEQVEGIVRAAVRKAGEAFKTPPRQPQQPTLTSAVELGPDALKKALSMSLEKSGQPSAVLTATDIHEYIRTHPVEVMEDIKSCAAGNPAIASLCDSIIAILQATSAGVIQVNRPTEDMPVAVGQSH